MNRAYDPDKGKNNRYQRPTFDSPDEDSPPSPQDDIRNQEENPEEPTDTPEMDDQGSSGGGQSGKSPKADSPNKINNSEKAAGSGGSKNNIPYNENGDEPRGRVGRGLAKYRGGREKVDNLRSSASKNKWFIGVALGGSTMFAVLIIALIIIAGSYKIVNFAEHVAAYNFARVTSQMAESTTSITQEKIAVDAADDATTGKLKAAYATGRGKVSETWAKLDKYRPGQIVKNYAQTGGATASSKFKGRVQFNTKTTALGRQQLVSVTVGNETSTVTTDLTRNATRNFLIPGYNFASGVRFSRDFAPALVESLKADNIGVITRAKVASAYRKELGISLEGWLIARFAGKSPAQANAVEEKLAYDSAHGSSTATASGSPTNLDETAKEAAEAEKAAVGDEKKLADIVKHPNETPPDVQKAVADAIPEGALGQAQGKVLSAINATIGFLNPIYKIATPLCLIYDGSIVESGGTMNAQSNQSVGTALHVQTIAAQQKNGYNVNAQAVAAGNWKLGDITTTNAERRASGIRVDTSNYQSNQASPTGQYSYSLADFLPGVLGTTLDKVGKICPAFTNIWVGAGVGVASVAAAFASGGTSEIVEGGTAAATEIAVQEIMPSLAARMVGKVTTGFNAGKLFAIDTTKQIAYIGAGTLMARQLVMSKAGQAHSSLAVGQAYDDTADAGLNTYANTISQRQFYGAPLQDSQLAADDTANRSTLALQESRKPVFERYLAVTNPNSLLSRLATTTSGVINRSIFSSLLSLGSSLFNPLSSLNRGFGSILMPHSFAAEPITSVNTYYGNVQMGYTDAEKKLIRTDKSYNLIENQAILTDSGFEDEINAKFGKCFTESVPDMLANGDLKRSQSGNVLYDDSLCSPKSLGKDNPDYPSALVFRYRLAHNNDNTLDQLIDQQTVTK